MDMPVEITLSVAGHRIMTTPIWFPLIFLGRGNYYEV